jgi:eukaryotic-like serine/threonine-protein kinase
MALTSGTKLGPYEIQSVLGAGGMGEVYRALDTRLDRTVAIKVLASHLSSSPELKQRMEREARSISALNHPHICQLYDLGSQDGTDFLVMEFLEGETLAERLKKGALPLNEILKIGIAVAEALAIAHRQGIVHRDLKPANIMLTHSGAKLMDFGLAKPLGMPNTGMGSGAAPSFTAMATLSGPSPLSPLTTAGSIIGTIQYMSPEQIEGKEADARSDIFAFGAVLYEMVTGKRPFAGKSQISLASSILEKDPDPVMASNPSTPPAFEHVLTTCLQKDPEERYLAAHDIKIELQWIAAARPSAPAAVVPAPPSPGRERLGWAAAIVIAIVLGVGAGIFFSRPTQSAQTVRTVVDPPPKVTLNLTGDFAGPPVLAPDGASLAFSATSADGKTSLWVRPMNALDAHMIPGTDSAIFPFWSPDSRSLGFFADGKVKTIDLNGGSPLVVCDAPFGRGGSWGAGGVIVYTPATQTPLMRVSATGGTPIPLTKVDPSQHTSHRWPFFLPDGQHLIYLAINHDPSRAASDSVYYASLDGRENRLLFRSQSNAVYGGGFLLFARGGQLMAQPFDAASGTLSGEPQAIASGVVDDISTWHTDVTASNNGLLVLGSGGTADWQLIWTDRSGKQIGIVADKLTNLQTARISPQGDRLALQIDTGMNDIWVLDLARNVRTRLTFGPVSNTYPVWSPDGKWIAYNTDRNGRSNIYRKPSDGSGAEELLLSDDLVTVPTNWSADGKTLFYSRGPAGSNWEVWALPLEGERKGRMVVPHSGNSFSAMGHLSPNGRWLAYTSTESGTAEVYVVAYGGGQGKWQVSTGEGSQPQWSKDGKELYFANDISRDLSVVPVKESNGALQFGAAQSLVTTPATQQFIYDVSPDGKRILLNVVSQQVSQSVTVITNFPAAMKK